MKPTTVQYVMAGFTILLGLIGIFLPYKYNIFKFKNRGLGAVLSERLSEKTKNRIPKIIGWLCVFTGLVVSILTYFLGEMPFE